MTHLEGDICQAIRPSHMLQLPTFKWSVCISSIWCVAALLRTHATFKAVVRLACLSPTGTNSYTNAGTTSSLAYAASTSPSPSPTAPTATTATTTATAATTASSASSSQATVESGQGGPDYAGAYQHNFTSADVTATPSTGTTATATTTTTATAAAVTASATSLNAAVVYATTANASARSFQTGSGSYVEVHIPSCILLIATGLFLVVFYTGLIICCSSSCQAVMLCCLSVKYPPSMLFAQLPIAHQPFGGQLEALCNQHLAVFNATTLPCMHTLGQQRGTQYYTSLLLHELFSVVVCCVMCTA